jgi:hypothetical protein
MDIPADKSKSDVDRPGALSPAFQTFKGFIKRMMRFFALTDEERIQAGIYTGGEGRDG